MTRKYLAVALGLVLLGLAVYLAAVLLPDLAWCIENYSYDRVPHCMWYENSLFGRFVQP
jgi:hypothetical protein